MKRAIPKAPASTDGARRAFDDAMKENLEVLIGHRGGKIAALPATASAADVIEKINELISRLQG